MKKIMTKQQIEAKRSHEKKTLELMIQIYCKGNHKGKRNGEEICAECAKLRNYAVMRTEKCPFMDKKTFCSACKVHCYSKDMQERIKCVMRYAGPRMMFYHPVLCIHHGIVTIRSIIKAKKER